MSAMSSYDELKRRAKDKRSGESSGGSSYDDIKESAAQKRYSQEVGNVDDAYINSFLEDANSYVSDSKNAFDNITWASATSASDRESRYAKTQDLGYRAKLINYYLENNKDRLDSNTYSNLTEALGGYQNAFAQVDDVFDQYSKHFSKWGSEEEYNTAVRYNGYSKKYEGKTSTELQDLIDSLEDGEEKEWLKSYEDIVGRKELLSVGDSTSQNYDPDFNKYVAQGKEYLYMTDQEYNRRIAEYDDMYFKAETNEERQEALAQMNALKMQYNNIKRTAPNFEGLDEDERQVYLYHLGKDLEAGTMDFSDTFYEELTGRKNNAASNKTLNFFQNLTQAPELLEDGFDWYDALLIPLGTVADLGVGLVKGAVNTVEGIVDYAGYGVAGVADLLGADGFADSTRDAMRWSFTDSHLGGISDFVDQASISGSSLDMLAEGVGQVLSVGKITKAGQAALNLGKVGTTVLSSLLTFSSSAGLGITEAYESGVNVTDAEAFAYGTMAGTAEALSELLWSGAGKLSNKIGIAGTQIGLDELVSQNVAKVFSGTFGRNVAQYMIGGAFEGVEGLASGFLQAVAKKLTYLSEEDFADIIANENLMEQFIAEALTSFLVQSPDLISKTKAGRDLITGLTDSETFLLDTEFDSYLQDSKAEGYELNDKQKDEIYEKTKNIINQLGEVSYKEAKKATKDAKKEARKSGIPTSSINPTRAESLTKDEVRGLLAANDPLLADEYMKKLQTTAEERLKALGQTEDVSKLAELAAKYATRQKLSKADKAFLANNKNGNRVANELRFMGNPSTYKSLSDRIDENESVSVSDNGKATVNGEEINIDKKVEVVDFIRDKETGKITDTIINADGKEVKASEIEYADEDQAYLFSAVKHIENITPADAQVIIRDYDPSSGISVGEYLNGIDEAYTYGYHGYTEADMKSGQFTTKLSDEKAKGAYELGKLARKSSVYAKDAAIKRMRTAVEAEAEKAVAEGKPAPEPKKMAITYNKGNGVVTDFEKTGMKLSKKQRAGVEVAKILHKLGLGTNFEFFESMDKDGNRVFINDAGMEQPAPAGVYMRSDGTIRIDLNAYNGRQLTLYTLSHELTHFIQQWSTEKYEVLAEYLVSTYEKTGITMHQRVLREQARLKGIRGENISYNEAYDEVVANAMMKMFDDGNLVQRLTELKAKDKNLAMKLWEGFKQILNKLLGVYQSDPGVFNDTKDLMQMKEDFEVLQGMFAEALVESSENFQAAQTIGFEMDMGTESVSPAVMHSEQTWTESDYVQQRDNAAKEIAKAIGVTVKKAKDYIDSVNSIAKMIAEDRSRLDYFSSPGRTSFVDNAEYGGSFDFSTLCKKRRLLTGTFTAIQKALPNTALTADEILDIRNRMKEAGLEVSCGLCYVEGSRANMGQFAKEFLRLYKQYYPDAWQPNMADVNTPDGIEWVRINHPECYEQYEYFWNHYGTLKDGDKNLFASQQKPKLYQLHTEYKGEILNKFKNDDKVEDKNLNGGIRLQSFSDFEIVHLIDTMQIIMDMSRVGLAGQAYTKVPDFAWALGDTGLKINLSLIAKGVDENGKLIFDDVEGMPIADAMKLRDRYSKNVGTILVAFNDAQLLAAMADERVDFIIPFHRSQWKKSQYEAMGLPAKTKDYTFMQNEKFIKPTYHEYRGRMVKDKASNYMPNEYWDFSKSGKENAEAYLEMCARNNKRPKFYKLLTENGDGSYSLKADGSTDGYWKLLIDFKMYDNDGNGSPQMAVKPDFNMDEATRMLNDYSGGHSNFPVAQGIVDDFVKDYKANHKGQMYSSQETDADYMDAVNRGDMETVQKLVDEAAKTAGYTAKVYHGTQKFGFTKIDTKKSDDGISFFAADDLAVAGSYANIIDPDARGINEKKGSISKKTVLKLRDQVKDIASEYLQKYTEILGYYDHWHMDHLESTKKAEWVKNQSQLPVFTAKAINAMATIHDDMMGAIDKAQTSNKKYPAISEETRQKLSDLKDEYIKKASGVISPFQDTGVYGLYANTDNHLVIDAQGGWWSDIKSDQLPAKDGAWNTRDVAKYAKENGYSGVTFKNLIDPANRTVRHPATVYVFFDPKAQLKSADPVTYTKLGRVIPLSKRFNAKNSDIRYSSQETDADRQQYNPFREKFAKERLDLLSDKLGNLFPLSAEFEQAIQNDKTPVSNMTVVANSQRKANGESYYTAGKNAFKKVYGSKTTFSIKQLGINADADYNFAKESMSKVSDTKDLQTILDLTPEFKQLIEDSRLLAVERTRHNDNKKTSLLCYRLYNAYIRKEAYIDASGNQQTHEVPHIVVFNVVQNLNDAKAHMVTDIKDVAVSNGHNSSKLKYATHANGNISIDNIAEVYDVVKSVDRKSGGLRYSADDARIYKFDYSQKNNGELYSTQETDNISNRDMLANAFETLAQNSEEYKMIQKYKNHIRLLNEYEDKLSKLNAEIYKMTFGNDGNRDSKKLRELRAKAKEIAGNINRHDKELLNLEASEPLRGVIEQERKKVEQKTKEHVQEIQKRKKERAEQAEYRHKIKNFKKKLEGKLLRPTDRQYVPVDLIKAMVEVCEIIDTDTDLYKADGSINKAQVKRNDTKEKLQNLKDAYEKLKNHSDPIYAGEFDEMVYTYLTELKEKFSDKNLNEMSLDELSEMYEILVAIDETLADARKLIGWGDAENVYEAGDAIVAEQNTITKKRKNGKRNAAQKGFDKVDNLSLSPVRNVERMSAYNQDSALLKLFKKFEQGIRKKNKFKMDAYKKFEELTTGKEYDDAIYKEVGGKKYTDIKGRKFGISKMQMMQAILSWEREQANKNMHHIENGGFTFADLDKLSKGNLKDAVSAENSHRVPAAYGMVAEFNQILKDDKWCQDYMKAAREFFNGMAKDAVNETSIALKHRIIAKDKNYIPFEVDTNFVNTEITDMDAIQKTINSYGMLKETADNAPQPLYITGLNNILDRHIEQVGNIYGLAIEVRNFNKVWNVRYKDEFGNNPTVKETIDTNWGKEGVKNIEQAVKDIQGPRVRERNALYDKVKSGYIGATFLLNLSVVTKQIGSLYSSISMLKWRDPARMMGNLVYTMANSKKISAEVDKYTATAWMRRQGMSDAELHTLMTEGKKTLLGRTMAKAPAIVNPTKWITAMDHAVALSLWKYAKQDTAKRTGLKGEELLKATAEFYDEVVENTQSMTDVLHRPEIQKRGDPFSEAVAMFKTDLYQMAGQLQAAAGRYMANKSKENGKALSRTVYSIAMSAIWGSLMTTVFALLRYKVKQYRDDDDDELTAESWLKRQGIGLAGDLMGYVFPLLGSEAVGVFENIMYGETDDVVDNVAITAVNDLYDMMITVGTSIKDGEMPDAAAWKKLSAKALQAFGIPANNILRAWEAIDLHAQDIANGEFFSFNAGIDSKTDKLYNAIVNGDTAYVDRIKDTYKTDDSYHNAVRTALRENDSRIKEAALAEINGNPSERVRIARLIIADGFVQDDVVAAINSEINALTPKEEDSGTDKKKGFYTTDNLVREFANGDTTSAKAAKSDIISTAIANGKTKEQAEKDFMSNVSSSAREAYEKNWLSESKAKKLLMEYAGEDEDGATSKVNYWTLCKLYPNYKDLFTEARTKNYHEYVKPAGISMDTYVKFLTKTNGLSDIKDANGKVKLSKQDQVIDVIDAFPITRRQKNALFLAAGYKESTLSKVRWS